MTFTIGIKNKKEKGNYFRYTKIQNCNFTLNYIKWDNLVFRSCTTENELNSNYYLLSKTLTYHHLSNCLNNPF